MKKSKVKLNLSKRTIASLSMYELSNREGGKTKRCISPSDTGCGGTFQGHTCGNGNSCRYLGCS